MAPQLDAAQHILIKTLLKVGFETKLIALKAPCTVRAVQRIRLKRQQFEMPNPRTNRVGRRGCITSRMLESLCDMLIEQPYLYRCEMADFLYCRFRKRISERSIGRTLRSIGWTRTTIHRIAQQRDADLRDHYLHRISQYKPFHLTLTRSPISPSSTFQAKWAQWEQFLMCACLQEFAGIRSDATMWPKIVK
jgi:hypothetical protein